VVWAGLLLLLQALQAGSLLQAVLLQVVSLLVQAVSLLGVSV
jgi:hypothetical protein